MKKYFKIQIMKKNFKNFFLLFLIILLVKGFPALASTYLPKKSFIMVYPVKTLSTSVQEEGDVCYFVTPSDLWIEEDKIIPKNSIFKAVIYMLKMPTKGINAAMKIKTESVTFPNGTTYPINGEISYKGDTQIGGNLTPPLSYNKALHIRDGEYFTGTIAQYVPSGDYEFGQHITIMPSETMFIILNEDFTPY